ncbi:hypothetical protein GGX14DRAFT_646833 [Mycena pura]|uniref:Uncharacterized protein n=1 Tax=Mycena pura TaxID=153505 RepID=A0AAD6V970_9AGAR|nr:hypothetical protein GGX14DRAFT_646833 [Mycena pura]
MNRGRPADCNPLIGQCPQWKLADHEELERPLPVYDPAAPVVEEDLSTEERTEKLERIAKLNAHIVRWLKYRARCLRCKVGSADPQNNPFAVLLAKLSGVTKPKKARQAYQQFMHEKYEAVVDLAITEAWAEECRKPNPSGRPGPKAPDADFHANTAHRFFAQLSATEQNEYCERAASKAKSRLDEYEQALKDGPSLEPAARQKCIENAAQFLGPILQRICDCTSLQGIVMLGGPLPGNNGKIGTVHVTLGQNLAPVPASFPAWAGEHFNKEVLGVFKKYLRTAYTDEEIKEAALDPLADAQYRISTAPSDVQDSKDEDADNDDSDDSDDSDGEDDNEEDKEEEARSKEKGGMKGGKKRMRGKEDGERQKKKAKTQAQGPTYEEIR